MLTMLVMVQGGAASPPPQAGNSVEQTITKLELAWNDAVKAGKPEQATALFADDAVFTDSSGAVQNKAGELNSFHDVNWDSAEDSDMKVVQRGKTAIVTGTFTGAGKDNQGKKVEVSERWTDVWMKNAHGQWQVVASHSSTLKK
jgi:ketosteroid isomerase-like protein